MYLFKIGFAFISVGGAGFALLRLADTPLWLKSVSIMLAGAALIVALPDLPAAIDGATKGTQRIVQMLPRWHAVYAASAPNYPAYCGVDPNGQIFCCNDHSRHVVIEYKGDVSPYSGYSGIRFTRDCY